MLNPDRVVRQAASLEQQAVAPDARFRSCWGAPTGRSRRHVWINSVHLGCGALLRPTSLVLTLRSRRVGFAPAGRA